MLKKKVFAGVGIFLVLAVFILMNTKEKQSNDDYIFDKSTPISLESAIKSRTPIRSLQFSSKSSPDNTDEPLTREAFPIDVDEDTLRYFHHLHRLYKESPDIESHLEQIRHYLLSNLSEDEAAITFEFYAKYLKCEVDLAEELQGQPMATDPESAIELLKTTQEFRRNQLGPEMADALFGAEVKNREYALRRAYVVNNKDLYGAEKEHLIHDLNEDMWEEGADQIDEVVNPYNRYKEKIKMYELDLSEMNSEEEHMDKIKELRGELFPEEIVDRLDEVDQKVELENENELAYYSEEEEILKNQSLTQDEKEMEIKSLQDEFFGDDVDAFRRSESMRAGLEKLITETEKNKS